MGGTSEERRENREAELELQTFRRARMSCRGLENKSSRNEGIGSEGENVWGNLGTAVYIQYKT